MDHRTIASPTGKNEYVHYANGGGSWAVPWLAGMFVLSRQVNPNITPEHFWEVAGKTGIFDEKLKHNIIQPEKLIDALQKEKGSATLKKTLKNGLSQPIQDSKMKGKKYE